jgi:succinate dehydrogenase/fumarate reductase flavoprotein subunit
MSEAYDPPPGESKQYYMVKDGGITMRETGVYTGLEWPYPVNYGKENEIEADVLVLGGGIAGCHAAINAAKKGARVAIVDKGPVIRSGSGGAGVDHWHCAIKNPCCTLTMEDMLDFFNAHSSNFTSEYGNGITFYILCHESYDALLDCERMGIKFRDEEDEFAGAEFRDDKSKIMFAYDYHSRQTIRVRQGAMIKPALHKELKRLGVTIYNRIMVTSLLTEGGLQGERVVGATGMNIRTGEFFIFRARASILSMAQPKGIWIFSTELAGASRQDDPNCVGDGHAIAWRAGAEFTHMEGSAPSADPFRYPVYGTGNAHNTWYAATIVDANGKEIPWVDRNGKLLKTVAERHKPAAGQKFLLFNPWPGTPQEYKGPQLIPDLTERIERGEFVLPFYADLTSMPEHERRAIFGLMVGAEGKTRIPIYENYTQAGFDPDKDMLQANVLPPQAAGQFWPWWAAGTGPPQWRDTMFVCGGGVVFDWDLKTTLEGLYAAGNQLACGGDHAGAAATGRYAGRKAVAYALEASEPVIDRNQLRDEKVRVYAPVKRKDGIGWKELQAGLCRVMQDYCGEFKHEETLKMGLRWLKSILESEGAKVYARNPHELARTLECFSRLTVGEMIIHASLARKASNTILDFKRIDYPEMDPPEWNKFITIRLKNGKVSAGELPFNYWLLPPYASTYEENYNQHCGL